jgi:hypothetical protein
VSRESSCLQPNCFHYQSCLQTALCYLEAIQSKVPELLSLERQGLGVKGELMPTAQLFPLPKLPPNSCITANHLGMSALCYLEAIQSKVPELLSLERQGLGVKGEPTPASQIVPTTEAEIEYEAGCCSSALTSRGFGTMCGLCSQCVGLSEGYL